MNRRTIIAIAVQLVAMTWVVVPPMWLARTGTVAWLETEKMDPRALFRGDYVILGYKRAQDIVPAEMAQQAFREGRPVYVTFTADRPARFIDVGVERPEPRTGHFCVVGRVRRFGRPPVSGAAAATSRYAVDFPQIAQYFVAEGEGRELEQARGEDLLARIAVNERCEAVLLNLEPR